MKHWIATILIVTLMLQVILFWPRAEASEDIIPPEPLTREEEQALEEYIELLDD